MCCEKGGTGKRQTDRDRDREVCNQDIWPVFGKVRNVL